MLTVLLQFGSSINLVTHFLRKHADVRITTWRLVHVLKVRIYIDFILVLCSFEMVVEQYKDHPEFAAINLPEVVIVFTQFCDNQHLQ